MYYKHVLYKNYIIFMYYIFFISAVWRSWLLGVRRVIFYHIMAYPNKFI